MKRFMTELKTCMVSAVIVGAVVGGAIPAQAQRAPAPVEVSKAETRTMAPQVFMPGTVVSLNDSRIAAEIAGKVTWIAPEGTRVKEGDVIAEIDDRNLSFTAAQQKAQIKRLEARIRFLKSDLVRVKKLVADSYAPASRLEESESNLEMAKQDLAEARIRAQQTDVNLARTKVRAPFPGQIVQRLVSVGEYSQAGREIARLVDTEHLEVSAQVPVSMANILQDSVPVVLRSGQDVTDAQVRAVIPVGDIVSRTMELRVKVPATNYAFVGSAVEVGLPSKAPETVTAVHRDALVLRADGTYVYRINDEQTAERIPVVTGSTSGLMVAVTGDVSTGDTVIIRGGERLQAGQKVMVQNSSRITSR